MGIVAFVLTAVARMRWGRCMSDSAPAAAPIHLPAVTMPSRRRVFPMAAAIVPIVGAAVMWLITGSPVMLWLAALGPLMAAAALFDAARAERRTVLVGTRSRADAVARAGVAVRERHTAEREALERSHPGVAGFCADPGQIWRHVPARAGLLVIGRGRVPSAVRVAGDEDDSRALSAAARWVLDAPVTVPVTAGVAIRGPRVAADAVVRGLAVQLLCAYPPGAIRVAASGPRQDWLAEAPGAATGLRLAVDVNAPADVVLCTVPPGAPVPPRCTVVLTLTGPDRADLDHDGRVQSVRTEPMSAGQARAVVALLADRAAAVEPGGGLPEDVVVGTLLGAAPPTGLSAAVGASPDGPVVLDLVTDGPHAVVAGMTGSGKSELLVTWVTAMAARHPVEEVTFLLADFKGGTAFARLESLPHVVGVITDLDDDGAERALRSLRAEIRWREGELARSRARDVGTDRPRLPRLVIVVDEFAALLAGHPDLADVFVDVAARGRALGMHLILGTQRAAGVVRESLLANCALRISLRVADPVDSRFLIGTADAALDGPVAATRGIAFVRRPGETAAAPFRVALTGDRDIAEVAADAHPSSPPRRPWLPDLPSRLELRDLPAPLRAGDLVLGLADDPDRQRQEVAILHPHDRGLMVVGGTGSGKSSLLAALGAQDPAAVRLPADPELLWDALASADRVATSELMLIDDVDVMIAGFPADYGAVIAERLATTIRSAGAGGPRVVMSAARLIGPAGRLADLLPQRAVLRQNTRWDQLAAGGEAGWFEPDAPPGRGRLGGRRVQFVAASPPPDPRAPEIPMWQPRPGAHGVVIRSGSAARRVADALAAAGAVVRDMESADAGSGPRGQGGAGTVLMGEPDAWQRHPRALAAVRSDGDLVVDAGCAPEYRMLTGDRELPPYCHPGRGRAWVRSSGEPPVRMVLPGSASAARGSGGRGRAEQIR